MTIFEEIRAFSNFRINIDIAIMVIFVGVPFKYQINKVVLSGFLVIANFYFALYSIRESKKLSKKHRSLERSHTLKYNILRLYTG